MLREHVDESFKGVLPGLEAHLRPLIVSVTNEAIENRVGLITRDLGKVMLVVGQHEEREKEMAEYLQNVVAPAVGERPAEGRYLVKALEHFELQLETLRENVGALMLSGSSGSVGMTPLERTTMDEVVAKFKSFGGKCHCPDVDVMDKRLLTLEAQVRGVIASGAPPPAPYGARVPSAGMCTGPFSSGAGCCGAGELLGAVTHPPGIPGGDAPACFSIASGGNGTCHCSHVTELMGNHAGHAARLTALEAARGRAPLIGSADRAFTGGVTGGIAPPSEEAKRAEAPWAHDEPLKVRPLGNMAGEKWEGRQLFDDKLMVQPEYMFDGVKGGVAWRGEVGRYFTTKVPALG